MICKIKNLFLPILVLLFLILLLVFNVLRIPSQLNLTGFTASTYPSDITAKSVFDGTFQSDFNKWFSDNFTGHNFFMKCYSQFRYSALNEGVGDWMIGKEKFLFSESQTKQWATSSQTGVNVAAIEEQVSLIKEFQTLAETNGKSFIYLLTPVKAEICTEYLPLRYQFLADRYAYGDNTNVEVLTKMLDKYEVNYLDVTEILSKMNSNSMIPAFQKTGHHWTLDATILSLNELFAKLNDTYDNLNTPNIHILSQKQELFPVDVDIYDNLNLFNGTKADRYTTPEIGYDFTSDHNLMIYGTSFGYEMVESLYRDIGNRAFNNLVYYSYMTYKISCNDTGRSNVNFVPDQPKSELGLLDEFINSDMIIIEQQNTTEILPTHVEFMSYILEQYKTEVYSWGDNVIANENDSIWITFENYHKMEPWGRWSNGNECSVTIKQIPQLVDNQACRLNFSARSYFENKNCKILVNGNEIGTVLLDAGGTNSYAVQIPSEYISKDENKITFVLDGQVYSPFEVGESEDTRKLGIGFESICLEAE